MPELQTLTVDEVLQIHNVVVRDFAQSGDPVFPHGVKSMALLESAVGRQQSGSGAWLKYPDPVSNASTLAFGICCDHAFHNGNKRTALVALLVHLDKNMLCLHHTKESDLYRLMLGIADNTLGVRQDSRKPEQPLQRLPADAVVEEIRAWFDGRIHRITKGERHIPMRRLRQILSGFGFEIEEVDRNRADIVRYETVRSLLRLGRPTRRRHRMGQIGYRSEGTDVSRKDMKDLREFCGLSEEDGVDTTAFYDGQPLVDRFVNKYRGVLRRLAKT